MSETEKKSAWQTVQVLLLLLWCLLSNAQISDPSPNPDTTAVEYNQLTPGDPDQEKYVSNLSTTVHRLWNYNDKHAYVQFSILSIAPDAKVKITPVTDLEHLARWAELPGSNDSTCRYNVIVLSCYLFDTNTRMFKSLLGFRWRQFSYIFFGQWSRLLMYRFQATKFEVWS